MSSTLPVRHTATLSLDPETEFFSELIALHYGEKVQEKLEQLSAQISWAKGWPHNSNAFWNAEAFMWEYKIDKAKRQLIQQELQFLHGGKNLDIGCGSYSYIPSVGIDFSEKMLQFNEKCTPKIQADLEQKLPFSTNSFDSVTAVFVLNYIQHYSSLLQEIKRIVKPEGVVVIILYAYKLNAWQQQKEVNVFSAEKWKTIFEQNCFSVEWYEKEKLWFFCCTSL